MIAPHWPTFYPILQRKAPLWDIYFTFPETQKRQIEMIKELKMKHVNWIILGDVALDNRDDLRFCNTHKLLWEYIMNNFSNIKILGLPKNYNLLYKKATTKDQTIKKSIKEVPILAKLT